MIRDWLARVPFVRRQEPRFEPASLDDASAIAGLHAASFRRGWSLDEIESLLLHRNVLAHRARVGSRTVGFVLSRQAGEEAEILSIAIAVRAQGRAIGRRLLDLHLRGLAGLGVSTVFLEVDENNQPARRLYARAGFREVGRRQAYYQRPGSPPAAAVVLRRDLI